MDNSYSENSQFRSSTMSGLRPPTRYTATAPPSALNEITDSQANARIAAAMPPPSHGLKRPNTDYRELCPQLSTTRGIPRPGTDRVSQSETAQPDAKRKPQSLVERAGEYKPTKSQLPPPKVTATKATSIVNLAVSYTMMCIFLTVPIFFCRALQHRSHQGATEPHPRWAVRSPPWLPHMAIIFGFTISRHPAFHGCLRFWLQRTASLVMSRIGRRGPAVAALINGSRDLSP
ncbi:hypothetical protein BR93DRAFT_519769 [Coniochaeta sp. PMI_546]|nr:hypothetical protein BR93DRAFT_519769 [Coniochaeta sp. PMI_546]